MNVPQAVPATHGRACAGQANTTQPEFAVVLASEEKRLFAIALAILRDPSEAEDAVQETAIVAWKAWDQRTSAGSPRGWLATICVHHCLRRRKGVLRRLFSTTELTEQAEALATHVSVGGRFVDLERGYASLSRRQRAVVSLHYAHGYSLNECAGLMHCSPGAVASHLSRALTKLRKELSHD